MLYIYLQIPASCKDWYYFEIETLKYLLYKLFSAFPFEIGLLMRFLSTYESKMSSSLYWINVDTFSIHSGNSSAYYTYLKFIYTFTQNYYE